MWHHILHWKTIILRRVAHMSQEEMMVLGVVLVLVGIYCLKGSNRRLGI